jgi:hypothetical protein
MDLLSQDLKVEKRLDKSKESWTCDEIFNHIINTDFASKTKPAGTGGTSVFDLSDEKLDEVLKIPTVSRTTKNYTPEDISQIMNLKADERWLEALTAFNTAPSSLLYSSRTLDYQADCSSLRQHSLDLSLAKLADRHDDLEYSRTSSPQIHPHTPSNSLSDSRSSSPSFSSRISSPETAAWSLKSLLIHDKNQYSLPALTFTTSSFHNSPSASASTRVSLPNPRMEIIPTYAQVPGAWSVHMGPQQASGNPKILSHHALGLKIAEYDCEPTLSPIGSGYVQHPNTPIPEPTISASQSVSQPPLVMPVDCLAPPQMDYTHVNPQAIMAPQPTRPSWPSGSWISEAFPTGQSEISGQRNVVIKSEAEAVWYDTDSIPGAQDPTHQQGRTDSHAANPPRFRQAIMRKQPKNSQIANNTSSRLVSMPQLTQGFFVQSDSMSQPNHQRHASTPAATISKSCPDLLLGNEGLDRIVAEQKHRGLQGQLSLNAAWPQAQQGTWSPTNNCLLYMPNASMSSTLDLPIRNASVDSMRGMPPNSHTKAPGSRPQPLSIPNELHHRSPSKSPGEQLGHQKRRSISKCHHRRKSSSGGSSSPKHAQVGFVNFTPSDSQKLLGGVAPSGSSKTKARREREAADKRRRISEAAKQAVLEVGGDVRRVDEALRS